MGWRKEPELSVLLHRYCYIVRCGSLQWIEMQQLLDDHAHERRDRDEILTQKAHFVLAGRVDVLKDLLAPLGVCCEVRRPAAEAPDHTLHQLSMHHTIEITGLVLS